MNRLAISYYGTNEEYTAEVSFVCLSVCLSQSIRLQNSPYFCVQVRMKSQTKGLEWGWKRKVRLGRDTKQTLQTGRFPYVIFVWMTRFFLSPHTPFGHGRLARLARMRLLRCTKPILRLKTNCFAVYPFVCPVIHPSIHPLYYLRFHCLLFVFSNVDHLV